MKTRQKKDASLWGKVCSRPLSLRKAVRTLTEHALDLLAPPRAASRALRSLTAPVLLAHSERAAKIEGGVEALFAYRDPLVRQIVWELKYRLAPGAVALAAECLAAHLAEEIADRALFEAMSGPLLISIPASPTRMLERGGDPLSLLASRTASLLGDICIYTPHVLYKLQDTKPQTTLTDRAERLKNVANSFAVHKDVRLRGRDMIVLDDVTTTGATFAEARRALRAVGARHIMCVALAH